MAMNRTLGIRNHEKCLVCNQLFYNSLHKNVPKNARVASAGSAINSTRKVYFLSLPEKIKSRFHLIVSGGERTIPLGFSVTSALSISL